MFSQTHSLHARISQDASADAGTRPAEVDAAPTTEPAFKHYYLGERPATSRLAKHPDQVKVLLSSAHLLDLRILGGIHRAPTKLNSKAAPKCSYQCSCSRRASAVVTAKQEGFPDVAQLCEKVGKVSALVQGLC